MNYSLILIDFARAYAFVYMLGCAFGATILILLPGAKPQKTTAFERVLAVLFIISFITTIITYDV